ncbi:MAG: acyl carrier protein [Lachnospiraceae bacterium]|nr:acyl carrier protein [Butyrivibrio sp.]MBR0172868.1 acyl carrier protein [Lachnospiraceae bacterium]
MEELEKLKTIVASVLNLDPKEITPDTTFIEDLGADSLDVFQIIMDLEDAFDIKIPQEEAEKITTVGQAADLIKAATEGR